MGDMDGELPKNVTVTAEKPETSSTVPNALKETEKCESFAPAVDKTEKKKAVLQIAEAYDMAKVFNAQISAQQQPIGLLCEKYLNLNLKKRPQPCFAVSIIRSQLIYRLLVH